MLYSKWDDSVWYTYWVNIRDDKSYKLPTIKLKESQIFEICDVPSYTITYREIKRRGIENVINEINDIYAKPYDNSRLIWNPDTCRTEYDECIYPAKNPTDVELNELKEYIKEFINDVDETFKWVNFFKLYWLSSLNIYFKNIRIWI